MYRHGTVLFAAALLALAAASAAAQAPAEASGSGARLLPKVRHFADLRADPWEPRLGAGLASTDLLATPGPERPPFELRDPAAAAREVQAIVALGATLPLVALADWPEGGMVLGIQAGVTARFRIELPTRDDLGEDWFVALPLELRHGAWSGRLRLSHKSSHLGDEFIEETGAPRLDSGGEALDLHVARDIGGARPYVGGSWIWRSYLLREATFHELGRQDRVVLQAGVDGGWPLGASTRLVGAFDLQLAQRTGWHRQVTLLGGVRASRGTQAVELRVRVYDGPSMMGQFFLTRERYMALEFGVDL